MTMWSPELPGRKGPRYRAIADALAEDLAAGELRRGSAAPDSPRSGRAARGDGGHGEPGLRRGGAAGARQRARSGAARSSRRRRGRRRTRTAPTRLVDLGQNHPPEPAGAAPARRPARRARRASPRAGTSGRLLDYPAAGGNAADREAGRVVDRAGRRPGLGRRRARLHREPARAHRRPRDAARAGRPPPHRVADLRGPEGGGGAAAPAARAGLRSTPTACGPTRSRTPAARGARRRST